MKRRRLIDESQKGTVRLGGNNLKNKNWQKYKTSRAKEQERSIDDEKNNEEK